MSQWKQFTEKDIHEIKQYDHIAAIGGLGNKLTVMTSLKYIIQKYNIDPLKFIWVNNRDSYIKYSDIFKEDDILKNIISSDSLYLYPKTLITCQPLITSITYNFGVGCNFPVDTLKSFKFTDEIENLINMTIKKLDLTEDHIGIHIRVWDKIISENKIKNIQDAIEKFEKYVKNGDKLYISSNSQQVFKHFINKYNAKNLFNIDRNISRSNVIDMKNSFLEMMLLSKCKKIIGTAYSTFSGLAFLYSNIKNVEDFQKIDIGYDN